MNRLKNYTRHSVTISFLAEKSTSGAGEPFFRDLEVKALQQVIGLQPAVIALGGGAPLREENQAILQGHVLIYLTASPEIVFQRIMAGGIPSFF